MSINDILSALSDKGLGATDALTHETVISGATLDENINADGGLTLSWKSEEGGLIRGGTMFLGYVMKENYVPTLGSDGLYMWSPKFSEPAVLLGKNNYGKKLIIYVNSKIYLYDPQPNSGIENRTVVAVVSTDEKLPDASNYATGTLAIVRNPDSNHADNSHIRYVYSTGGTKQWYDGGSTVVREDDVYRISSDGWKYWRYVGGEWIYIGAGDGTLESTLYTSPFCGPLGTIVDELNLFLAQNLPSYERDGYEPETFRIVLCSENPDPVEAAAEISALRNTFINVTFDGSTLKKLIDDIAEAAEAHAYYIGRKIVIGKTRAYADTEFFNRFVVLGGNKNMAKRTATGQGYAAITQRLHLDETDYPGSVIDLRTKDEHGNYVEAPFETFLVFDEVYPKLNLNIDTAKYCLCYCLDEDGKKIVDHWEKNGETVAEGTDGAEAVYKLYAKWYVTLELDGAGYEIDKSYIIQDKPLSLLFQSGPLTGRQFELTMLTTGTIDRSPDFAYKVVGDNNSLEGSHEVVAGECYIILEADGSLQLPTLPAGFENGGLCPQAGNWVTLVNVAIEDRLRVVAQRELLEKGMERARLIYESKQPTVTEERTFTDVITGRGSGAVPGLGKPYKGYIVTGISENVITGVKTVTYGTFKPKSLLKSAIDKIEAFTLSGGESTTGKEVSTKTDGQTTYIYIHYGNEGGDNSTPNSGKSSGTSQGSVTAIREAGGNTNIKTIYKKMNEGSALGELVSLVWNHLGNGRPSSVSIVFDSDSEASHSSDYWYNGNTLRYGGSVVSDAPELVAAFTFVYAIGGDKTYTLYTESKPGTPAENDIYAKVMTLTLGVSDDEEGEDDGEGETIEGGLLAWLWDGEEWVPILESTSAIIDNMGDAIKLVVFGSTDGSFESAGVLTTQNCVTLFAQAVSMKDGNMLAEAAFGLGIRYRLTKNGTTRPVRYDTTNSKWIYTDTTGGDVAAADEQYIEAYGFSYLSADTIDFTAQNFRIGAGHIDIGSNHTLNEFITQSSGMLTTGNFVELFSTAVSKENGSVITQALFGLTVKYHYVGGSTFDVEWDGHNWYAVSDHEIISGSDVENIQPYSLAGLTADVIDFKGKTIGLTAQNGLTINGGTVAITSGSLTLDASSSIDLKAAAVSVRTDKFSIYPRSGSNTPIQLFSNDDKLSLNFDNASINTNSIAFSGSTINVNANQQLSFTCDGSGNSKGVISFAGTKLSFSGAVIDFSSAEFTLSAEQLNLDADDIIELLVDGDTGILIGKDGEDEEGNDIFMMGKISGDETEGYTLVAGLEFTVIDGDYILNLNANNINLNAENITWKGENGGIRDIITNVETIDGQQVTVKKFSVDADGNVTMNDLTANNATLSGILTSTGVRTKITIDATDGSDTDTAMKMFALVSDNGSTIAKPVLKVGIDDYLYDENDPQSVYQEGAIEICTTDEVHPYRKATVRPQRITVEGNSYVTEIKPSRYYIYNRSDYYSGNNPTPLLEISDSGVRHGGVFKFWTDILANS